MLDITISDFLKSKWAETAICSIYAHVKSEPSDDELWKEIESEMTRIQNKMKLDDIAQLPIVSNSRKAYKACGKDPSRYRLSSEALLRRIIMGKGIYRINNLVEITNLVSISEHFTIGTFDVEKIFPPVVFSVGNKTQDYRAIERGLMNIENLPAFIDQHGCFGTPTSDSERTKITSDTKILSLNIISFSGKELLKRPLERTVKLLEKYASATQVETRLID